MKFDTIHHIAVIVSDYNKSREFYVNKLGFEIIYCTSQRKNLVRQNCLFSLSVMLKQIVRGSMTYLYDSLFLAERQRCKK